MPKIEDRFQEPIPTSKGIFAERNQYWARDFQLSQEYLENQELENDRDYYLRGAFGSRNHKAGLRKAQNYKHRLTCPPSRG